MRSGVCKFNFGTIAAFLTWFGGAGYILSNWGRLRAGSDPRRRVAVGLVGAAIIFLFVAKVLAPGDIRSTPPITG